MTQQRRTARTWAMQRRRKIIRRIERATGRVFTSFEEACTALVEIMMPVSTAVVEGLQAFALVWQNLLDECDSSRCYPDLTDPDTRAMYLRRLAVALGADPHHADCGVTIGWIRGVLMVWAGIPDTGAEASDIVWPFERAVNVAKSADKTTALALAWPADKRGRP